MLKAVNKSDSVMCFDCGLVWKVNWKNGQVTNKDSFGVIIKEFAKVKMKDIVSFVDKGRNKIFVIGKYDIVNPELLAYPVHSAKENVRSCVEQFKHLRGDMISSLLDLSTNDIFSPAPYGPKSYDKESLESISRIFKSLSLISSELKFLVNRVYSGKTLE